jgi:hypothetical protein
MSLLLVACCAHPTADCSAGAVATPRRVLLTLLLIAVLMLPQLLARMLLTLLLIALLVLLRSSSHAAHPTADCIVGAVAVIFACCSPYCWLHCWCCHGPRRMLLTPQLIAVLVLSQVLVAYCSHHS